MNELFKKSLDFYKITGKKPNYVYLGKSQAEELYKLISSMDVIDSLKIDFSEFIKLDSLVFSEYKVVFVNLDTHIGFGL